MPGTTNSHQQFFLLEEFRTKTKGQKCFKSTSCESGKNALQLLFFVFCFRTMHLKVTFSGFDVALCLAWQGTCRWYSPPPKKKERPTGYPFVRGKQNKYIYFLSNRHNVAFLNRTKLDPQDLRWRRSLICEPEPLHSGSGLVLASCQKMEELKLKKLLRMWSLLIYKWNTHIPPPFTPVSGPAPWNDTSVGPPCSC